MKSKLTNTFQMVWMFFIITTILVGCSNVEDELEDISLSTESTPVELTFYMPGEKSKDVDEVLTQAAEASNLNIRLNFKWAYFGKYHQTIETAIASNEKFDAFLCGRPLTANEK